MLFFEEKAFKQNINVGEYIAVNLIDARKNSTNA